MKPSTLRLGSVGADVITWQRVLGQEETGTFDTFTEDATRAWQRVRGIEPDGVVGGITWGVAGFATEALLPVKQTIVTMADYVRAVVRAWGLLFGGVPLEASIAVLYAQYIAETGGRACWNWNIGNVKKRKGDGYDYHMLRGVWEGATPAEAERLIASGQASHDPSSSHAAAVPKGMVSVIFNPPHVATWFRAFATLDEAMRDHLQLLERRFAPGWGPMLAGDYVGFAYGLKSRGYFTADAGVYARLMKAPYEALIATSTYEELVATQHADQEGESVEVEEGIASLHDAFDPVAARHGAMGVMIEDMLEAYRRERDSR